MLLPYLAMAQGDGGGDDPDVPIDGGLSVLLAAGIGYGARQVLNNKNHSKHQGEE